MASADAEDRLKSFLEDEDIGQLPTDLNDLNDYELDVGEKANNAEDYGDISDEDLADDQVGESQTIKQEPAEEGDDPFDDLFGDDPDSPQEEAKDADLIEEVKTTDFAAAAEESEEDDAETREQRLLFEQARIDREERMRRADTSASHLSAPPTNDDLFRTIWPQFELDNPPRFTELLPGKKAYYVGKAPLKPPRPVHLTKVNLELGPDQEKLFKTSLAPFTTLKDRWADAKSRGLVLIAEATEKDVSSDDEETFSITDEQDLGTVTWQDLITVCQDWDVPSEAASSVEDTDIDHDHVDDMFLDDDFDTLESRRPAKKIKLSAPENGPLKQLYNVSASFDSPEKATAKLAKKVHLDLNDPNMLVDETQSVPQQRRSQFKRDAVGGLKQDFSRRYNISNDDEYDLLKQNHSKRVRSQIGNLPIEHAGPALRLQYPFYKQSLTRKEARMWHRPALNVIPGDVTFKKPVTHKRKHLKGKAAHEIFAKASDLTIGDNSNVLLFEYSEEMPPMLSSMGMGSKLINYYRRKDDEDTARPRLDYGETSVLLPQDKSPFDIFGDVDRGQMTPTLSNSMYRAPVFRHAIPSNDFLISRNTTGVDGSLYFIRNIEGIYVVGQEFPYQEVPGPKARFATNVGKARLQMVSYRMFNKSGGKLSMDMVRVHNPNVDVPTIRTKMREFMGFDKSAGQGRGVWVPKSAGDIPDEAGIRGLVKPEEVALLYAMQVGQQHLLDAGYHKSGDDEEDGDDEEGSKLVGSLDRQLAPWNTTKNFLLSCTDKAMIEVYGDGDPTGRGEALSMIKTSMKGGFKALGQSIEDRLDAQKQKELGGHKYNVARQRVEYSEAIRRVWEAQSRSLSATEHREDIDMEGVENAPVNGRDGRGGTPRSSFKADESASVLSRASRASETADGQAKVLKITRRYRDKYGAEDVVTEIVRDPRVIRAYRRRKREMETQNLNLAEMEPTGDPELDAARRKAYVFPRLPTDSRIEAELDRLYRNVDRRHVREKAKAAAGSPGADGDDDERGGRGRGAPATQRKCANCGMVGHIKTNKKLCPMLNGTVQTGGGAGSAFGSLQAATPTVEQGAPAFAATPAGDGAGGYAGTPGPGPTTPSTPAGGSSYQ